MKVVVTVDYYDGSKSKSSKAVEMDEIDMTHFRLRYFCDPNVCGITITKAENLNKVISKIG